MPLRPEDIGGRVVVRYRLPGQTGPSGGPAMTDVVGVLEALDDRVVVVRDRRDRLVEVASTDIVAAKPVPPAGDRRSPAPQVSAHELARIGAHGWPAAETAVAGDWLLRAAGGFTGRANSVLVVGNPEPAWPEVAGRIRDFYRSRELPVRAQLVDGDAWDRRFEQAGWRDPRPDQPGVLVQVTSVRAALTRTPTAEVGVHLDGRLTDEWLDVFGRGRDHDPATVRAVLGSVTAPEPEVPSGLTLASLGRPVVAVGRGTVVGDWLGLSAVTVDPAHRRRGLGSAVVAALLRWGDRSGARFAYLQVAGDNDPAIRMYAGLGFRTHHRYRYRVAPDPGEEQRTAGRGR